MPDNKKLRGKADRDRVNTGERYELAYEAKKMKTTPAKVKAAAKSAGPMRKNIEKKLKKKK
jgi:hypothetical protein